MANLKDAAKMPGAGKKNGSAPPVLACQGVTVAFTPITVDGDAKSGKWFMMSVDFPAFDVLEKIEDSIQWASLTFSFAVPLAKWDDADPAHRRGGYIRPISAINAKCVRRIVSQLHKHGFKTVRNVKGGAK